MVHLCGWRTNPARSKVSNALGIVNGGKMSENSRIFSRRHQHPIGKRLQLFLFLCCEWTAVALIIKPIWRASGLRIPRFLGLLHPRYSSTGNPSGRGESIFHFIKTFKKLIKCALSPAAGGKLGGWEANDCDPLFHSAPM